MKYFLSVFAFTACLSFESLSQSPPVIVVRECDDEIFQFSFIDDFLDLKGFQQVERRANIYSVYLSTKTILNFSDGSLVFYPVLASPGDTIRVKCDPASSMFYEFTGTKGAHYLSFLLHIERKFKLTLLPMRGVDFTDKLNYSYFFSALKEIQENAVKFVDHYADSLGLDNKFRSDMSKTLFYSYQRTFYSPYLKATGVRIPDAYADSLRNHFVIDTAFQDKTIKPMKQNIFGHLAFLCKDETTEESKFACSFGIAKEFSDSEMRDYTLFLLLKERFKSSMVGGEPYLNEFKSINQNVIYADLIDSIWQRRIIPKTVLASTVISRNGSISTFEEVIQKHKNTVL